MASRTVILFSDAEGLAEHSFTGDYGAVAVVNPNAGAAATFTVNGDDIVADMAEREQYGVLPGGRRTVRRDGTLDGPTLVKVRLSNPSTGEPVASAVLEVEVGTPGELSRYEIAGTVTLPPE